MADSAYVYDLIARDRASAAFRSVGKSADGMGSKIQSVAGSVAKNMGRVGIVAAIGAAKAVSSFSGFQGQMNEVFTLLPGISEKAMGAMTGQVKDFSKEFGVLPDKVVPALYQSLSAGVPKGNVFEFLEVAQKAAKGGVTELETAVSGITGVVNAYGADVIGAAKASDLMFTTVKLGRTTFDQLSSSLGDVTPIAGALGVTFEEISAAMAASTAITGNTAKSTTGLRSLLSELGKAGQVASKNFERIAGKTFPDFIKGGGDLAGALQIMKDDADRTGGSIMDMFGGVEAGASALQLAGSDVFLANLDEMRGSAGATEAAFDRMMTGLGPIFDRIKANFAVFMLEIGERLAPYVEQALSRMSVAFGMLSDWWSRNGPQIIARVQAVRDAIAGWIAEVGPVIESWVKNVLGSVSDWWDDNGGTIISTAETLRDTLVAAFRGVQKSISFVIDYWDQFKVAFKVAFAFMIPAMASFVAQVIIWEAAVLKAWLTTKASAIKGAIAHSVAVMKMVAGWVAIAAAAVVSGAQTVAVWLMYKAEAVKAAAAFVVQVARQVAAWVLLGAQSLLAAAKVAAAWLIAMGPIALVIAAVVGIVALIITHWDTIKSVIAAGWEAVKKATAAVWDTIKSAVGAAINFLVGIFMNFTGPGLIIKHWDTIKRFTSDTWNKIKSIVSGTIDSVVGFISGLGGRITGAASGAFNGIKDAFRAALNWIVDAWNRLSFPSFPIPKISIPGVGDLGGGSFGGWALPNIPRFHGGGIYQAPAGAGEGLAILKHGERTLSVPETRAYDAARAAVAPAGPTTIVLRIDASNADSDLVRWIRRTVRVEGGGDVQVALGQGR